MLNVEEFTLHDLVSSIDAIVRPMAGARSQEFHVEVKDIKHERLLGDETRINQILINLLSNAVKYTPEGGNIWFRIIGLGQHSSQFEHIRIEVEDDGYGMTQEYLKTIFDAFTRAENSTTNKVQGTGLGMAITKNIVEPDAERALSLLQDSEDTREAYQLVLLDVDVPVMGGLQTLERIRNLLRPDAPLLFMTDHDGENMDHNMNPAMFPMEEALRMGYTGVLTKPFFISALKESVMEMQAEESGENKAAEAEEAGSLQGLHFLAAEDNEINAEILSEILAIEGASCEIAENGKLAAERFANAKEGEFDAILMDVQMPVMNGYDATRAIRAMARKDAEEIPIIAMTANAFAEDEREALNAGMNVHLAKPIDVELLKQVIRQWVRGKENKEE